MGSVGALSSSSRPDEFAGALGTRSKEEDISSVYFRLTENKIINPNFSKSLTGKEKGWDENCALCATAVALQVRGYDVEAMPRDYTKDIRGRDVGWRGFGDVFDVDYTNTDNYILSGSKYTVRGVPKISSVTGNVTVPTTDEKGRTSYEVVHNPPKMPRGAAQAAKAIEDKVKGWGNGAVGVLNVKWRDTSYAHAINVMNIQGKLVAYDAQSNKVIKDFTKYMGRTVANHTSLVRVDNAPIKKDLKNLDKMVKRRNK